jgi:SAM-dependent methyltransferase
MGRDGDDGAALHPPIGGLRVPRLERERDEHDRLARALHPASMAPEPPGPLERALLDLARPGPHARVLDLGCGSGDLTLELVRSGAAVMALDVSQGMLDVARERVALFCPGAAATFIARPAEATGLADASVDLVVGRFILHHLDVARAAAELARITAPGGRVVLIENSGRNPVLMAARRHLAGRFGIPRLGTEDERPLSRSDVEALRGAFGAVELHYPVFDFFRIFDRQVLRFRWGRVSRLLSGIDDAIHRRMKGLRRFSFRVVTVLSAPRS